MKTIVVTTKKLNGSVDSIQPVTLKNAVAVGGASRLDSLVDVDATVEVDGATLVYDSNTGKYVVKPLDLSTSTGTLDGGTF